MKQGDSVRVFDNKGNYRCDGVVDSVTETHATVSIAPGTFGPRCRKALRRLSDLELVGAESGGEDEATVADMTVKELKAELAERELSVSGNKADLVERLEEAMEEEAEEDDDDGENDGDGDE